MPSSLIDAIQQAGVSYRLVVQNEHAREGWVQLDCPDCGDREKFHLGVSLDLRGANCWKCGPKKARQTLRQLGIDIQGFRFEKIKSQKRPRGKLQQPSMRGELTKPHIEYLKKRGFDYKEIEKLWGIEGISQHSTYSWSIYLPIYDINNDVISWTTRAIAGDRRYSNAPKRCEALPAKSTLYGIHLARSSIVVVEGPTDAWRIGPGAVATMGLQYTTEQVQLIRSFANRTICFDSSVSAQAQARKLFSEVKASPGNTSIIEIDADDPGECDLNEVNQIRNYANL